MTGVYAVVIGLAVVILLLGLLVVAMLRSHAEILRRLDKLGVRLDDEEQGAGHVTVSSPRIPRDGLADIAGVDPAGDPIVVSTVAGSDPVLLAFLSTSCSSCTVFWEALSAPLLDLGGRRHRVVIVTLGSSEESPTRAASARRGSADVVMSSDGWSDYQVPGAPYFVLIDPLSSQVLGEGTAGTVDALHGFLRDSAGDQEWDRGRRAPDRTDSDREQMIDAELREAGLEPGDPRLYHGPDDHAAGNE